MTYQVVFKGYAPLYFEATSDAKAFEKAVFHLGYCPEGEVHVSGWALEHPTAQNEN